MRARFHTRTCLCCPLPPLFVLLLRSVSKLAKLCNVAGSPDMKQDKLTVMRAAVHTICELRTSNAQLQQALSDRGKVGFLQQRDGACLWVGVEGGWLPEFGEGL